MVAASEPTCAAPEALRLTAAIQELEAALEHAGGDVLGCVEGALGELKTRLAEQVTDREQRGYLRPVTERRPTTAPVVARLKVQQRAILEGFERVWETRGRLSGGGLDAESLRQQAKLLLDHLRRHIAEENNLVQRVFNTEIGGPD